MKIVLGSSKKISSSCDLDEWTSEQLEIMKLSGNANARAYFKSHGLTDGQMMVNPSHFYYSPLLFL